MQRLLAPNLYNSPTETQNRCGWGNFEEVLNPPSQVPSLPKWNDLDMERVFPVVIICNGSLLLTRGRTCIVFILAKSDQYIDTTLVFEKEKLMTPSPMNLSSNVNGRLPSQFAMRKKLHSSHIKAWGLWNNPFT